MDSESAELEKMLKEYFLFEPVGRITYVTYLAPPEAGFFDEDVLIRAEEAGGRFRGHSFPSSSPLSFFLRSCIRFLNCCIFEPGAPSSFFLPNLKRGSDISYRGSTGSATMCS